MNSPKPRPLASVQRDARQRLVEQAEGRARVELALGATYARTRPQARGKTAQDGNLTAATLGQYGMVETRDLAAASSYTAETPLGPLDLAVERLRAEYRRRPDAGHAVPVLVIGAGQRLTEATLRTRLGNRIDLTECSPRYAPSNETDDGVPIMDRTLPAAGIDTAVLPTDAYMLVYSVFGSFYGHDQIGILQKVIDSLMVGGECFLQWPLRRGLPSFLFPRYYANRALTHRIERWAPLFRARGVDLVVTRCYTNWKSVEAEVWGRKLRPRVDLTAILAELTAYERQAAGREDDQRMIVTRDGHLVPLARQMRFTRDGPWLPMNDVSPEQVREVVERLVQSLMRIYRVESSTALWTVVAKRRRELQGPPPANERELCARLVDYCLADGLMDGLERGVPLATLLQNTLTPLVAAVNDMVAWPLPETLDERLERMGVTHPMAWLGQQR